METNTFGARLKALREHMNMSQEQLAAKLNTSKQVISRYENGLRSPKISVLADFSEKLGIDIHYFLAEDSYFDYSNVLPIPSMNTVPLIGDIACGSPILAEQNIEGDVEVPEHIRADFALRCRGNSMRGARILDGDIVYIRQQPTVDNGEIAAVLIDDEATLKRVYIFENRIVLQPENPEFAPLIYVGAEMGDVHILGKAVAFTSVVN